LFTSKNFGRRKDGKGAILEATERAVRECLEWVGRWNRDQKSDRKSQDNGKKKKGGNGNKGKAEKDDDDGAEEGDEDDDDDKDDKNNENEDDTAEEDDEEVEDRRIHSIHMCKINAGLVGVPWEDTLAVLEKIPISVTSEEGERMVISTIEVISP
jgi:hypothetical protein